MSYDLMVFDPKALPPDREGFMDWYWKQMDYPEGHNYDDPEICSPELRSWFLEMILEYPAMNGPYASDDIDNPKLTQYSIGSTLIYACFGWPEAEQAYGAVFELAKKHRLGFFNVSAINGQVWEPTENDGYESVHGSSS